MVALNCVDLTIAAYKSIQSKEDFVFHLIDQASTDGTKHWADRMGSDRFFHHTFNPRVSLSEAWNRGIQESLKDPECQYIFAPNNDVLFHKTTIDNLMWGIDKLGHAMVTGENIQPKMTLEEMNARESWGSWEHDSKPVNSWLEEGPDFSCWMIKRDFVKKHGWFDENYKPAYCEDQDMHIRIRLAGNHAKRLTIAPYYHIASQTVAKNANIRAEVHEGHQKNIGYYREKWGGEHGELLKGNGFKTPFNQGKSFKWWEGCEKYE